MNKVAIIGAGNVGATAALYLAQKEIADLVLLDIDKGRAQGIALDILQASPVLRCDVSIEGTDEYSAIRNADLVVITAGVPRKPGMDRMDLLRINAEIVHGIVTQVVKHAPGAIMIVVSNPIDLMVYLAYKLSGFPKNRVIGMAGVLDSARFAAFVSMELNVSVKNVTPMVLGGHGDHMVPLPRYTMVNGIPITQLISKDKLQAIITRTQNGGAEIVNYLKTGSAFYAPAASTVDMVEAILKGHNRIVPCSCYLDGEYALRGLYLGVPAVLGKDGVQRVIDLELTNEESKSMQKNGVEYKSNIEELHKILPYLK